MTCPSAHFSVFRESEQTWKHQVNENIFEMIVCIAKRCHDSHQVQIRHNGNGLTKIPCVKECLDSILFDYYEYSQ
jgi:hypothetical protein